LELGERFVGEAEVGRIGRSFGVGSLGSLEAEGRRLERLAEVVDMLVMLASFM
jgi:hypothetical protein